MVLFNVITVWAFMNIGMIEASFFDNTGGGYVYYETVDPSYFVEYGAVAEIWRFEFSGGMENTFYRGEGERVIGGFVPVHDTYWIGAKFKLNDNLWIVGEYQCEHTVDVASRGPGELSYDASRGRIYAHINTRGPR